MYQILVAEEEAALRKAMCADLQENMGSLFLVREARNSQEALALFEQHRPQVAILSVELSGTGGMEVARQIRRTGSPCMLLFLSAFETFSSAREAISLRALNYLTKPCPAKELIQAVGEAFRLLDRREEDAQVRMLTGETLSPREEDPSTLRLGQVRMFIEEYIRDHYQSELSMQDVARAMNYSDAYFCKLFKQCFNVNFSVYLNEYRIGRARELLQSTRLSIRDISLACGYADANYFARIFKRITGMTPTEYRVY